MALIKLVCGLRPLISSRRATIELIFAGAIWGFGFIATQWALAVWTPVGLLVLRFLGAWSFGELVHLLWRTKSTAPSSYSAKSDLFLALPAGLMLGSFLLLQTLGLQYTSATKSGFITTLYVIFVPVLNGFFFKKKSSTKIILPIALACFGTFLLLDMSWNAFAEKINEGDLWTLASAIIAALQIIYVGRISQKVQNAFRWNNFQFLWALVPILPFLVWNQEFQRNEMDMKAVVGIFILAAACSVIAFSFQIRAQKVLSDTTASMLFLLESPFAFLFAFLLLGDRLNGFQSLGAFLIVGAALWTVLLEQNAPTNKTPAE
jgi:drug/metabolite transporter (DMT)-like permease